MSILEQLNKILGDDGTLTGSELKDKAEEAINKAITSMQIQGAATEEQAATAVPASDSVAAPEKKPLFILDTDIGFDPDDILALVLLLKSWAHDNDGDFSNLIILSSAEPPQGNQAGPGGEELTLDARACLIVETVRACSMDLYDGNADAIFAQGLEVVAGKTTAIQDPMHFSDRYPEGGGTYQLNGQPVSAAIMRLQSRKYLPTLRGNITNSDDPSNLNGISARIKTASTVVYAAIGAQSNIAALLTDPEINKMARDGKFSAVIMALSGPRGESKLLNTNDRLDPKAKIEVLEFASSLANLLAPLVDLYVELVELKQSCVDDSDEARILETAIAQVNSQIHYPITFVPSFAIPSETWCKRDSEGNLEITMPEVGQLLGSAEILKLLGEFYTGGDASKPKYNVLNAAALPESKLSDIVVLLEALRQSREGVQPCIDRAPLRGITLCRTVTQQGLTPDECMQQQRRVGVVASMSVPGGGMNLLQDCGGVSPADLGRLKMEWEELVIRDSAVGVALSSDLGVLKQYIKEVSEYAPAAAAAAAPAAAAAAAPAAGASADGGGAGAGASAPPAPPAAGGGAAGVFGSRAGGGAGKDPDPDPKGLNSGPGTGTGRK
jgi:hypothetical protein